MGALSHIYERRVRTLNPTLVPHWAAALIPLVLSSVLITLTMRFIPQAQAGVLAFPQYSASDTEPAGSLANDTHERTVELSIFTAEVRSWSEEILRWSQDHDVPPTLVAIVMQIESCGAPNVRSSAGAMGLFQVMPFHFLANEDPFEPETNAARGITYLTRSYELSDGSIEKTLAGYNGGHSVIDWDPANWAGETKRYVAWGMGIWDEIQAHKPRSETLEKWLSAGGSSLCLQARNSLAIP